MAYRHGEVQDLSLDDFRSVAARDDDPEAHDAVAAEEDLHQVDPFVDPELGEVLDEDEIEGGALDHEASIDEILDETTHSHDPAREIAWADDEVVIGTTEGDEAIPEPLHSGEFQCSSCFLVLADRLRAPDRVTVLCLDCSGGSGRS